MVRNKTAAARFSIQIKLSVLKFNKKGGDIYEYV